MNRSYIGSFEDQLQALGDADPLNTNAPVTVRHPPTSSAGTVIASLVILAIVPWFSSCAAVATTETANIRPHVPTHELVIMSDFSGSPI
jgi:hypothetical protein